MFLASELWRDNEIRPYPKFWYSNFRNEWKFF